MRDRFNPKKLCPVCHSWKGTRKVGNPPGISTSMKHWVCDSCKIGWYDGAGTGPKTRISGTAESARTAYVPKPVEPTPQGHTYTGPGKYSPERRAHA